MQTNALLSIMGLLCWPLILGCSASLLPAGAVGPFKQVSGNGAAKATITFISHGDMSTWIDDVSKLRWGSLYRPMIL